MPLANKVLINTCILGICTANRLFRFSWPFSWPPQLLLPSSRWGRLRNGAKKQLGAYATLFTHGMWKTTLLLIFIW